MAWTLIRTFYHVHCCKRFNELSFSAIKICNIFGKSHFQCFLLFFPPRFPFDYKTPFGYLGAFSVVSIGAFFTICCEVYVICFIVGSTWLFSFFVQDIAKDLPNLNAVADGATNERQLKLCFGNIARCHSDVKRFVGEFNEIYEFITFTYFLWSISSICSSIFVVQMQLVELN